MSDPIETIMNLSGCTKEQAEKAYDELKDIVEAVDSLMEKPCHPEDKYITVVKHDVTPEEKIIAPYRKILKELDEKMSTSLNQRGHEGSVEKLHHHEEMVLQNNYSQECQLPALELEVQTQETVCPLPSECSYDLPLSAQISGYFHQE
jgi:hypothetical protein